MADFQLVLAGPIVRRVEPTKASVWLALSKKSTVKLDLYQGPVLVGIGPPAAPLSGSATASTIQIGQNLHVVVVTASATGVVIPGSEQSYNVTITPDGGASADLKALGLLETTTTNGYEQPPLGFVENFLPRFRTPPPTVSELRIAQGGCRKPHDAGPDALVKLAEMLDPIDDPGSPIERVVDPIPQMLFLSGDQIYADDVSIVLLPLLNTIGNSLIGTTELLNLQSGTPLPATLEHFPNGLRNPLVNGSDAFFTSTECDCHLLSFAEFSAMYLLALSNVLWPPVSDFQAPTPANPPPMSIQQAPAITEFLFHKTVDELTALSCEKRQRYCEQLCVLKDFVKNLGKVRQALANIATYMICDDHEVTDDWNLTLEWKEKVNGSKLGRQVLRNALTSYAFFQAWGNDPDAFATGGVNAGFLDSAATAITGRVQADVDALDAALGLGPPTTTFPSVRWDYRLLDSSLPYGFLVLDERTRRGYRSRTSPPARIEPTAEMPQQIPATDVALAGREVLFVIAAAPVLGLPVIEELLQPAVAHITDLIDARAHKGQAEADQEPWSGDPLALERLLSTLAPARRIVFLSGDVHFGHGAAMTYWPATGTPARFVQFTSSALKNSGAAWELNLIRSIGLAQRLFRMGQSMTRLGWTNNTPNPLSFSASAPLAAYPPEVRSRFLVSPLLLPAKRWPADVGFVRQPDWTWSMTLLFDERPEADRKDDRPLILPNVPAVGPVPLTSFPEIARYHIESMKKRGVSRQTVFAHNIGVVALAKDSGGKITATHTLYSSPLDDAQEFEALTIHTAVLEVDAAEQQPGLQA